MIDEFLDYFRYERNRSPRTIDSYELSLKQFEAYFHKLDSAMTWGTVDADVIRDWLESMMDEKQKASSVHTRLSALKSFYRWALSRGKVKRDPAHKVEPPKAGRPLPHFMRESEMDKLLDGIEWGDSYREVRARTIIMTFYETGVRVSELTGLDDDDIDFDNCQLKVTGKGNKQRIIPFGQELKQTLENYRAQRNREVERLDPAFFLTDKGRRMDRRMVGSEVSKHLALVSSQKKLSPHVLRHTFATAMLNHGASIESVRRLLGHASVSTTEIYTHTTFEQLKRVYQDAHPRA